MNHSTGGGVRRACVVRCKGKGGSVVGARRSHEWVCRSAPVQGSRSLLSEGRTHVRAVRRRPMRRTASSRLRSCRPAAVGDTADAAYFFSG